MFYIRKIELDIDSLKVRFDESLLDVPQALLPTHTPESVSTAQSVQTQGGLTN